MPVLLAILSAIGVIAFYVIRARNAANAATDLIDVAQDVMGAARRFGFRRRANIHPIESIEEPNIGVAVIANAFLELNDLPTQDMRDTLLKSMQSALNVSKDEASEMLILAKWLQNECGSADAAIHRAGRKTARMAGTKISGPLMEIIQAIAYAAPNGLSEQQKDALGDIKRTFRL